MLIDPSCVKSSKVARACWRARVVSLFAACLLLGTVTTLQAATLTATWNPNPEPDIAGYKLSYGAASGSYTSTIDVGNTTSYVLSAIAGQTYYFVVRAYNTSGLLSPNSVEVASTAASAPTLTSLGPTGGPVGTSVTITGTNFGATQSTSTVTFNGTAATPTSWSATSIVVPVPAGATTGNVVVTVGGGASNALTYTVTFAPSLTSLAPTSGPVGTSVTITGTNFGATKGTSTVTFNGTTATPATWSAASIVVPVPAGATTGNVVVTVGGAASNALTYTVSVAPSLTSLAPTSGPVGTSVSITGTNFGATKGTSTVTFNGTMATPASWSAANIVVPVPAGATTGNIVVTVGGVASNTLLFTVNGGAATIAFVQGNAAAPGGAAATVTVPWLAGQTAGDGNVVVVGWNDASAQVLGVTDTRGNAYVLAVGPTVYAGVASQAIYYATNIAAAAAGANAVTVTFTGAAVSPVLQVAEYAGVDTIQPVDATAAGQGATTVSSSGAATTTATSGLLVAATLAQSATSAGAGFTQRLGTSGGTSVVYGQDTFTAADGTALSAHAPETGGAWIADQAGLVVQTRAVEAPNFGDGRAHQTVTPAAADYEVQVDVTLKVTGWGNKAGVRGRDAGGYLGDAYEAYFNESTRTWMLDRWRAFGLTPLGSYADPGFTAGTKTLTLRMVGSAIQVLINGTARIAVTDAALTGANHPGLRSTGGIHDGLPLTNYVVRTVPGAGAGPSSLLEDRLVTAAGTYTATAAVSPASPWIMQLVALRATSTGDTQAPTAPGSLAATPVSSSRIDLTWTASTDNVGITNYLIERCQGAGCTTFAQVATSPTPSVSNTGLTALTGYTYRVRATDAAGNLSGYSTAASATTLAGAATIAFVQGNAAAPGGAAATVTVPWLAGQTAGDGNVVVVGWNDASAQVLGVTDTRGNAYVLAVGPTVYAGVASQAIYYATNIAAAAAGANAVTVTFTGAAVSPVLQVAEYAGVDTIQPVDATAAGQGATTVSSSGAATTTATSGLLVAATLAQSATSAGAGFTQRLGTSGGTSVVYGQDTFTAADGTALSAHAPETGGAWIADQAGLVVQTRAVEAPNFGDGRAHQTVTPAAADYEVQVDVTLKVTGWGNKAGVRGRDAGGYLGDAYEAYFNESTRTWMLDRWRAFGLTPLGSYADPGFTAGTKTLTLRMVGSAIQVLINGTARIAVTDAALTGANHPGLRSTGGIHDGLPLTNYVVRTVPGAGAGPSSLLEDRLVTAAGTYTATAAVSPASPWIMQLVALRAAGSGGAAPTSFAPTSASTSLRSTGLLQAQAAATTPKNDGLRASDYDGDRKSDLAVFNPATSQWAILLSSTNYMSSLTVSWGASTDVPVPGDYDGDGKPDIAVYRPSEGTWYILQSSTGYTSSVAYTWGAVGDIPMPGDYDGDGTTDLVVYRPSTGEWFITLSATKTTRTIVLGASGDVPVIGDFDGDRRTDIGVFTPSIGAWTILKSSTNYTTGLSLSLGATADVPVPGDYDGDGLTDAAIYRTSTGTWSILESKTGYSTIMTVPLSDSTDVPVPGDYDADGQTDVAVYRPSTGLWTIVKSSDGSTITLAWGISAGIPVPRHP